MSYSLGAILGVVASAFFLRSALKTEGYEIRTPRIQQMVTNMPFISRRGSAETSGFRIVR